MNNKQFNVEQINILRTHTYQQQTVSSNLLSSLVWVYRHVSYKIIYKNYFYPKKSTTLPFF